MFHSKSIYKTLLVLLFVFSGFFIGNSIFVRSMVTDTPFSFRLFGGIVGLSFGGVLCGICFTYLFEEEDKSLSFREHLLYHIIFVIIFVFLFYAIDFHISSDTLFFGELTTSSHGFIILLLGFSAIYIQSCIRFWIEKKNMIRTLLAVFLNFATVFFFCERVEYQFTFIYLVVYGVVCVINVLENITSKEKYILCVILMSIVFMAIACVLLRHSVYISCRLKSAFDWSNQYYSYDYIQTAEVWKNIGWKEGYKVISYDLVQFLQYRISDFLLVAAVYFGMIGVVMQVSISVLLLIVLICLFIKISKRKILGCFSLIVIQIQCITGLIHSFFPLINVPMVFSTNTWVIIDSFLIGIIWFSFQGKHIEESVLDHLMGTDDAYDEIYEEAEDE